tara:strand:+ start:1084 stop:1674 length:591 start_codon:yes stop_codon:yes gene_type:complete
MNIPLAEEIKNVSNIFKKETNAVVGERINGDPHLITERQATNVRQAERGKNFNKKMKNITTAEKIVSKITLYNSNDSRIKNVKFRGINLINTGKELKTISGVKLFRLVYPDNVNNEEYGTYIYMADWIGGGINGTTIPIGDKVAKEISKIEEQDQMNLMNENRTNRTNGGKKTRKRKVKNNKNKKNKKKTIKNKTK